MCRRSLATEPATCTKPRVRRRRRAGTCCAPPIVPRRRRVSIRVDVKTYASCVLELPLAPTGPSGQLPLAGRERGTCAWRPAGGPDARAWVEGDGADFFRHPQPRRACAGGGRHLRLRWTDVTAGGGAWGWPGGGGGGLAVGG